MPRLSPAELAHRRKGLGSTCIVEACGLAPWKGASPMRLFNEKLGIVSSDDAEERDDDREDWLEWGHTMEPIIADWYARKHDCALLLGGHVPSPEHDFMWATLDRKVVGESRLVEIKNVGSPALYRHWDTSSPDGIPEYVRGQVTIAMGFSGAAECDIAAAIGGRPPHVWRVFFDAELFALMVDRALAFWRLVQSETPPPLDATAATRDYLRAKFPRDERSMLESTAAIDEIAEARRRAAFHEKEHSVHRRRCDAQLMAYAGDAKGVSGPWGSFTWKINKAGVRVTRFTERTEREERDDHEDR